MKKIFAFTEVKYAILLGLGIPLWVLAEYAAGLHGPSINQMDWGKYTSFLATSIPVLCLLWGIREKRSKNPGQTIRFSQAMQTGMTITLLSAVITTLFFAAYYRWINPGYVDALGAYFNKEMLSTGATDTEIQAMVLRLREEFNSPAQTFRQFMMTVIGGTLMSAVISFFLKKAPVKS